MGKVSKRHPVKHSNHHDNPHKAKKAVVRRQHSQNAPKDAKKKANGKSKKANVNSGSSQQPVKLKVPFNKQDRVLLVGEGDFSFALSLCRNHDVRNVVATCFDSKDTLLQKYPNVGKTLQKLSWADLDTENSLSRAGTADIIDTDPDLSLDLDLDLDEEWAGVEAESARQGELDEAVDQLEQSKSATVFYGIDATKLSSTHKKTLKAQSPFTKIVLNFPHVGGLSTDVNRQVRSNQQLLVNFFSAAKPLLATKSMPAAPPGLDEDPEFEEYNSDVEKEDDEYFKHGQILVTLFEGEPYTLWNIRDLARHSGLKVLESFKFPWSAYPGYQHARTIGDITSGKDRAEEGKRKGAWRGEERDARCYVLALKDDNDGRPAPGSRKRKKEEDDSD